MLPSELGVLPSRVACDGLVVVQQVALVLPTFQNGSNVERRVCLPSLMDLIIDGVVVVVTVIEQAVYFVRLPITGSKLHVARIRIRVCRTVPGWHRLKARDHHDWRGIIAVIRCMPCAGSTITMRVTIVGMVSRR